MADIGLFTQSTIKRQLPGIVDQIIKDNVYLTALKEKNRIKYNVGGDGFQLRVRKSTTVPGGAVGDWTALNAITTQPVETLTGQYRKYAFAIMINRFQKERNENAGREAKMFDMVAEQLNDFKQNAQLVLSQHLYGTSGTPLSTDVDTPMDGLEDLVDNDNTYMGIDRATNSYWQAQVDSIASSAFFTLGTDSVAGGLTKMNEVWNSCCQGASGSSDSIKKEMAATKSMPDITITSKTGFEYYERCLRAQYRYTGSEADSKKQLSFNEKPIVWDSLCTANRYYFLTLSTIKLEFCGKTMFDVEGPQSIMQPRVDTYNLFGQGQHGVEESRRNGALRLT